MWLYLAADNSTLTPILTLMHSHRQLETGSSRNVITRQFDNNRTTAAITAIQPS
jgi:hypothetical protein